MVYVLKRMCRHQGCAKGASFGMKGKKPELCAQHATEGMVNIRTRVMLNSIGCAHPSECVV